MLAITFSRFTLDFFVLRLQLRLRLRRLCEAGFTTPNLDDFQQLIAPKRADFKSLTQFN